jgi:hypothetical protein
MRLLSLLVLCGFTLAPSAFAAEQLSFEPKVVQLSGLLTLQSFYGPANHGESPNADRVEVWPILELDAPIDVAAVPKEPDSIDTKTMLGVKRIQLVTSAEMRNRLGHRITVEGRLSSPAVAHDRTDAIMWVTRIVSDNP